MGKKYKAVIYQEIEHPDGSILLKRVTSAKQLTVMQIAAAEEVSYQTISQEIQFGRLKARRIGSCIRIDLEEYLRWREECEQREYERGDVKKSLTDMVRHMRN